MTCIAVSDEDSNIFLTGSNDLTVKIWDIRIKQPVQKTISGHDSAINDIQFLPGRIKNFATGSEDSTILLHDIRVDKPIMTYN